jgi:YjbE family integral membrane protein
MDLSASSLLAILEVVWINIILSGDNAVVIALACRGLPPRQRRTGMVLGAGVAVLLRVVFTLLVVELLSVPFLRIAGSLLLLWVAVKLLTEDEDDDEDKVRASGKLWQAVRTVALADMVMSLDNVLAIAAVAKGSTLLLVLGLLISVPLIVAGATLVMALLSRFPILVWAGAALLGWVAGEMLDSDPLFAQRFGEDQMQRLDMPLAIAGAAIVVALGWFLKARKPQAQSG